MSNPFEQKPSPWPPFIIAALTDIALIVGGFVMYQRTDSIWWLIGGVAAGASIITPASMKLVSRLRERREVG